MYFFFLRNENVQWNGREGLTPTLCGLREALYPECSGSSGNIVTNNDEKGNFLLTCPGKVTTCLEHLTFLLGPKSLSLEIVLINLENKVEELSSEKLRSVNIL